MNSSHQKVLALFAEHRGVLWTEEIGVLAEQLMALASALPAPQIPRSEDAYDLRPGGGQKPLSRRLLQWPGQRHDLGNGAEIQPALRLGTLQCRVRQPRQILEVVIFHPPRLEAHKDARRLGLAGLTHQEVDATRRKPCSLDAVERGGVAALLHMAQHGLAHVE